MAQIDPETYRLMLERTNWDNMPEVHMVQAIAADDVTLTNIYTEFVDSRQKDQDENNS